MRNSRVIKWPTVVCIVCLLLAVAIGEQAWHRLRFVRRGVERPPAVAGEQRPGVNVDLAQYDRDELERVLDDVSELGFHWLRQRFPWREIEPRPGQYRWERWDTLVAAVHERGLELIAVLDSPPDWAVRSREVPLPCVPPWREEAFAQFAAAFATRYGSYINHYQVWDEPNLSRSWGGGHVAPCGYVTLLAAAYGSIHNADPEATVLSGGLAPTQAPGPENLNDLAYLRQLYAMGGARYFDILAAKAYGFWSGPDDRRVEQHTLNFSRLVAVRELMRTYGDSARPVWAVEWGWNSLPPNWQGVPPPWGNDRPQVQGERIRHAVARARAEWPWLGVMCWAEYQPASPADDPRWGFALRDADGAPTALYDVLRNVNLDPPASRRPSVIGEMMALCLAAVALSLSSAMTFHLLGSAGIQHAWQRWASLPARQHLAVLIVSAVLYVLLPWPEWVSFAWLPALAVIYLHPAWALQGAALSIPLAYAFKPAGKVSLLPVEVWLSLAMATTLLRRRRRVLLARAQTREKTPSWQCPSPNARPPTGETIAKGIKDRSIAGLRPLHLLWGGWVLWGALSASTAPDPSAAWREWHTCMLGPALFHICLSHRIHRSQARLPSLTRVDPVGVLRAWLLSGVIVSIIGIAQWLMGMVVPAGEVERVTGVYYSPNHLALYLERLWPLALSLALCGRLRHRWRLAAWSATGIVGMALYLTFSRGAWLLALPTAMLMLGLECGRGLRRRVFIGGGGILAAVAIGVVLGRADGLRSEIRIPLWQSTLAMIADHPWRGVGLDGFRFVYPRYMRAEAWSEPLLYHPHNMWLDTAVRLGVPGIVLFAMLIVSTLRVAWRQIGERNKRAVALGMLAGVVGGLAHGLVDSGYFLADLAWSLALVTGTLSGSTHLGQSPPTPHQERSQSSASSSNSSSYPDSRPL